jgi:uncharacterized protein (TIRG00374 family)
VPEVAERDLFPRDLIRKIVPVVLAAVVLYVGFFVFFDAKSALRQVNVISIRSLGGAALLAAVSFLLRAVRWHVYLRLSQARVPLGDTILSFLVGLLMSLTPGKVGEVLKSLLLKEAWQVPISKSAPILVAERVTDLIAVLLLGGSGLLAIPKGRFAGVIAFFCAFTLIVLCTIQPLGLALIERAARVSWIARRREKLLLAYSSLTDLMRISPFVVAMALASVSWGLQSFCVEIIANTFPGIHVTFAASLVASCAPILAGALALVPGGLGATEASMTGLLLAIGGAGMSAREAVAITIYFRVVTFWFAMVLGLAALVAWRVRHRVRAGLPDGAT